MAAGHRGYKDLLRSIKEGAIVSIDPVESSRNSKGQWTVVIITVLDVYGNEKSFRLRAKDMTDERIQELIDKIDSAGAIQSPSYPVTKLADRNDVEEVDDGVEDEAA